MEQVLAGCEHVRLGVLGVDRFCTADCAILFLQGVGWDYPGQWNILIPNCGQWVISVVKRQTRSKQGASRTKFNTPSGQNCFLNSTVCIYRWSEHRGGHRCVSYGMMQVVSGAEVTGIRVASGSLQALPE